MAAMESQPGPEVPAHSPPILQKRGPLRRLLFAFVLGACLLPLLLYVVSFGYFLQIAWGTGFTELANTRLKLQLTEGSLLLDYQSNPRGIAWRIPTFQALRIKRWGETTDIMRGFTGQGTWFLVNYTDAAHSFQYASGGTSLFFIPGRSGPFPSLFLVCYNAWIIPPALPLAALTARWLWRRRRRVRRRRAGQCVHCGYDLRGLSERCPECGQPFSRGILPPPIEADAASPPTPPPPDESDAGAAPP
jgi:hypothetical protein